MKKTLLFIILSMHFILTSTNVTAQSVKEGSLLIDGYYGFPNLYTTVFKTTYVTSPSATGVSISGIGPIGLRGEYLLTNRLGLGVDLGFNNTRISDFQNSNGTSYKYTFYTQKTGVMASLNIHFITSDKVDFYGVVGAGYANRTFSFTSTEPGYSSPSIKVIPISVKLGLGIRYFFTKHVGINLGFGIGQGGLLNGGLTLKI